ncbi:MAG: carboxypeptidase regulatory-like domain-containing protein [Acidobacteriota bacterium]|nr:carboxypeptidase regulatory-like domain-containing protein [Acidobacteriota bacterium]
MSKSWKARLAALFTVWALVVLPLSAVPAMAQATTGTLRGVVVDPNGGVVVGATVTAKNEATGTTTQPATTNNEGVYEFASLPPGSYTLTVEAAGFKRSANTGVQVKAGIVNPFDAKLEAGNVAETVTVTANTEEVVQREQSQISTTVDTRKVEELPSNAAASGLDTLALLAPGVFPTNSGGVNTNGTGLNVNGNRARSNNFQIDGSDNNDLSVAGPALFVDNQDQIQELQVITNNFSAQYGRNQGAIINYVTKGGGNEVHGSAFEFHRDNRNLNSLDNIEKRGGQKKPNQSLFNVFGGTVGGPLPLPRFGEGGRSWLSGKDRFFFFVTYQGVRNPQSVTLRSGSYAFLPSQFPLLQAAFPGNAVVNAITTQSVFAVQPGAHPRTDVANPFATVVLNGQTFQVAQPEYSISEPFNETDYSARFDIKASNKDNISFRYLHQNQNFANILAQTNGFTGDLPAGSKNFGGIWTRTITPSIVSEARVFYQRIGVEFGGGCNATAPGCIPGPLQIGSTFTNIGLPVIGGRSLQSIGPATNLPQGRIGKVYQFADNLTWLHGKHSFIIGGEFKHLSEVSPFLPNFNGAFAFNSATRLINNAPSSISLTVGDPTLAFTENDQYYFVQDDFKVRPNLTLNLGVRYEYTGQPINILSRISQQRESNASTAVFDPSLPLSVRTVPSVPADKNNFAPRVGFAYSPHFWKNFLGEDATVIRGGFSIAYEPAFYNILGNVQGSAPFSAAIALGTANALSSTTNSPLPLPGNAFGNVIRSTAASSGVLPLGKLDPRFLSQTQVARDFHSPYSEQWSLGVQHQFGRNNVAEVRYVGTRGVGLFQNVNGNFFVGPLVNGIKNWFGTGVDMPSFANLLPPGTTAQVCKDNPATPFVNESTCNQRLLPQAGITVRQNSAFSIYHSMQSRYNGRFFNNALSLGAAYTFSKTIDNASEIFGFDIASPNAQNPFCAVTCEKARSQIDRPHALSLNFIYDIPLMKEQRGVIGHLLGGWQVNGVYVLTSGEPYTPGQFFNGSVYGLGNAYLTSGDRPFSANPNVDPRLVGISQLDAALLFGVDVQNINGFYSMNALNSTGNAVPVTPNDVRFIVNTPNAARIFGTPFGSAGRNILRGPRLNQLNASLFKNIKVTERVSLHLRGEAYNVLNHPNPGYGVNQAGYLPDFFVEDAGVAGSNFADRGDIELARRVIQVGLRIVF